MCINPRRLYDDFPGRLQHTRDDFPGRPQEDQQKEFEKAAGRQLEEHETWSLSLPDRGLFELNDPYESFATGKIPVVIGSVDEDTPQKKPSWQSHTRISRASNSSHLISGNNTCLHCIA